MPEGTSSLPVEWLPPDFGYSFLTVSLDALNKDSLSVSSDHCLILFATELLVVFLYRVLQSQPLINKSLFAGTNFGLNADIFPCIGIHT